MGRRIKYNHPNPLSFFEDNDNIIQICSDCIIKLFQNYFEPEDKGSWLGNFLGYLLDELVVTNSPVIEGECSVCGASHWVFTSTNKKARLILQFEPDDWKIVISILSNRGY